MRCFEYFSCFVRVGCAFGFHCGFDIVPLCGARIKFTMAIERVLLITAPYASCPFINECDDIYNIIWLNHDGTLVRDTMVNRWLQMAAALRERGDAVDIDDALSSV
mmetsp:Transcript_17590/g.37194  ORF Transcript_17590/g.37194 Transcript_17590/m.37194 type:complete len:106 (-) Transcript_17590:195-512(-)